MGFKFQLSIHASVLDLLWHLFAVWFFAWLLFVSFVGPPAVLNILSSHEHFGSLDFHFIHFGVYSLPKPSMPTNRPTRSTCHVGPFNLTSQPSVLIRQTRESTCRPDGPVNLVERVDWTRRCVTGRSRGWTCHPQTLWIPSLRKRSSVLYNLRASNTLCTWITFISIPVPMNVGFDQSFLPKVEARLSFECV